MLQERTAAEKPVRNTLLLQIPGTEFRTIKPHLHPVDFSNTDRLQCEGARIEAVYFLNGGIGSIIIEISDGRSIEVGLAGREDMIGLPMAAGLDEFSFSVVIRVPGNGFRVQGDTMKQLLPELPELRRLLLRRLAIRSVALAQNAACNRLHNVKQRLARWLLLTHDRLDSNLVRTTHDFLSRMVGTDRLSVTRALAQLEREGMIQPSRGSILVENRRKLEQISCECYSIFRRFNPELGLQK